MFESPHTSAERRRLTLEDDVKRTASGPRLETRPWDPGEREQFVEELYAARAQAAKDAISLHYGFPARRNVTRRFSQLVTVGRKPRKKK